MRILITGSEGFIGRHVVATARNRGHTVVCVDHLLENARYINQYDVDSFDAVIHLAAYIDIGQSFKDPWLYVSNNLLQMQTLENARRVVFASSAAVYGKFSPYGYTKRLGESLLPKNSISLRLFNPFGPGENHKPENHIVPLLAGNSNEGNVTTLYHDGEQIRDFIHVSDVALAFVMAAESDATGAYDLCSTPLSIKKVAELMKVPFELSKRSRDAGDTMSLVGDPLPLEKAIGFTPQKDVKEMLKNWRYWY